MSNKKTVALLSLALLLPLSLCAQEVRQSREFSDYRIDEAGKFWQRISWSRVDAYFYEVEFEKQDQNREWVPESTERTENIFIEVSLSPGRYRYRINNYNVLGRIAASSEWTSIRVFEAKTPAAGWFSPRLFPVDSNAETFTLFISGQDLFESAEVHLVPKAKKLEPLVPLELIYSDDDAGIQAVFSSKGIQLGLYDIVITNPGGLEQRIEGFVVGFTTKADINLSVGYLPLVPAGGYLPQYLPPVYPLGFYARASFVPIKRLWGSLGLEVMPAWSSLKTEHDGYTLEGDLSLVNLDLLYQRWFNNWTMAINVRAGAGLMALTGLRFVYQDGTGAVSRTEQGFFANANTGVSFEWLLWRNLFMEAGLDYVFSFSPWGVPLGLLRLTAGAGWRF